MITESSDSVNVVTQTMTPTAAAGGFPTIRIPSLPQVKSVASPPSMADAGSYSIAPLTNQPQTVQDFDEVRVCSVLENTKSQILDAIALLDE